MITKVISIYKDVTKSSCNVSTYCFHHVYVFVYVSGTNVTHSYKSSENVLSWTAHLNPQMRYYDECTRFVKKKKTAKPTALITSQAYIITQSI